MNDAGEGERQERSLADQLKAFTDQLTRIIAVLTASVGVIYAVGFIVINSSLLSVGVLDLSLLRTGYLSAGLAYIFLFAIISGISIGVLYYVYLPSTRLIIRLIRHGLENLMLKSAIKRDWSRWLLRCALTVFGIAFGLGIAASFVPLFYAEAIFVGSLSFYFERINEVTGPNEPMFWWSLTHAFIGFFGLLAYHLTRTMARPRPRYFLERAARPILAGTVLVAYFGVMLVIYGQFVYKTFPQSLGGGGPLLVQFVGDTEFITELTEIGVQSVTPITTKKVELLMETNSKYIVQVGKSGVSFDKSRVRGVRYYPVNFSIDREQRAQLALEQGIDAYKSQRWDAFESFFDDANRLKPCFLDALVRQSFFYLELDKYAKAKDGFDVVIRCITIEPGFNTKYAQAYYGLALVETRSSHPVEVIMNLKNAYSYDPQGIKNLVLLETRFNPIKARPSFIELFFEQSGSKAGQAYAEVGKTVESRGNVDWAREEFQRAKDVDKTDPNRFEYRHLLGLLELQEGNIDEAALELRKAAENSPENYEYYFHAGNAYKIKAQRGPPEDATKSYRVALGLYEIADGKISSGSDFYTERGKLYSELGVSEPKYFILARSDFDEAVVVVDGSKRPIPLYHLARLEARLGRYNEALMRLGDLLPHDPTYLKFVLEDTTFQHVIELPEFADLRNDTKAKELVPSIASEKNLMGRALTANGRLDEALMAYRGAVFINPQEPIFRFNLGRAFNAVDRLPDATREYLEAISLNPSYGEAYCQLARIYQREPVDLKAARLNWEMCLRFSDDTDMKTRAKQALKNLSAVHTG